MITIYLHDFQESDMFDQFIKKTLLNGNKSNHLQSNIPVQLWHLFLFPIYLTENSDARDAREPFIVPDSNIEYSDIH